MDDNNKCQKITKEKKTLFQGYILSVMSFGHLWAYKVPRPLREFIDNNFPSNSTASLRLQSWGCTYLRRMPHQACSSGEASTIRPGSHGHQSHPVSSSVQNCFSVPLSATKNMFALLVTSFHIEPSPIVSSFFFLRGTEMQAVSAFKGKYEIH